MSFQGSMLEVHGASEPKGGCTTPETIKPLRQLFPKLRLIVNVTLLQVSVQFVTSLSGFLLVRVLSKSQFAAYALASSLQTVLTVLTDSGLGAGVNAVGGKIWRNPQQLGGLAAAALRLRLRLAWFAVPLCVVCSLLIFDRAGVRLMAGVGLLIPVLFGLWGTSLNQVYAAALRLSGKYEQVQKLEFGSALMRLIGLCASAWIFINAPIALTWSAGVMAIQAVLLRSRCAGILKLDAAPAPLQQKELQGLVRKQMVSTVFFAFQGQLTIWLIATFGTAERVAEVGALGRLGVLFAIVHGLLSGLVAPTFAKCESLRRLMQLFGLALGAYAVFSGILLLACLEFSKELLWLLGKNYSGLNGELIWVAATSILTGLTGVIYALVSARGWIWHAWLIPIFTLSLQGWLLTLLDLGQVRDVLIFGCAGSLPTLVLVCYMAGRGLWTSRKSGALAGVAG